MDQNSITVTTLSDGNRTVAEAILYKFGSVDVGSVGVGSSGREPGDKYDAQTGEDLAVARALHSLASHLERRARGRVSHAESCKAHKAEIAERAVLAAAAGRRVAPGIFAGTFITFDKLFSHVDGPEVK